MKPTRRGIIAVIIISLLYLLAGHIEVNAGISLEQQRIDRERSAQRRHELELAKIQAQAYVEAAKYRARQNRYHYYIQTRPHYKHLRPKRR